MARICEDFNLTPVLARAHYEQMARYFADYGHVAIQPGELCYLAVASSEPPGKPIAACRKVQVSVELATSEDRKTLRTHGLAAMRRARLARLARQAQVQGGLLTVEEYLWGLQFTEIEQRTRHSEDAIRRTYSTSARSPPSTPGGASIPEIRAATGRSAKVIAEYIGIYERARRQFPSAPRLYELLDAEARRTKKGGRR